MKFTTALKKLHDLSFGQTPKTRTYRLIDPIHERVQRLADQLGDSANLSKVVSAGVLMLEEAVASEGIVKPGEPEGMAAVEV